MYDLWQNVAQNDNITFEKFKGNDKHDAMRII